VFPDETTGGVMAICRIIETAATPEEYDQVRSNVGIGDAAPPGAKFHVAAKGDDGKIRIIELWDSRDEAERFTDEKIRPAREAAGLGEPTITYMEVHRLAGV
jgi:hypothetical protein